MSERDNVGKKQRETDVMLQKKRQRESKEGNKEKQT